MSSYYFDTITDEQKYKKNAEGAQTLSELTVSSGSRWGDEHLKACHVVVNRKVGDCLPLLKSYDRNIRETFAVINHILLYTQDPSSNTPVEIRQPERWCIQVENKSITAIDDGGLTLIKSGGEKTGKSVVLIEAKRRLNVCDKTDGPSVPDEQLGQMACEAIAARSSMQGDNGSDDIFLINATQHYMCFFHFNITADHLEDLGHGRIPDNAIKVTTTRWFNLESPTGRKCIVKNVLQLAEYMGQMEGEKEDPLPLPDL